MLKYASKRTIVAIFAVTLALLALLCACRASAGSPAPGAGGQAAAATAGQDQAVHSAKFPKLNPVTLGDGEKLRVVATMNLLGDIVKQVGGDRIELTTLLPVGADPHSYSATPADLRTLSVAHVVFMVGEGVEESLMSVLENREGESALVAANTGIDLHKATEDAPADAGEEHQPGELDPHTWTSVPNVEHWVQNIDLALSALDPANAAAYHAAAATYTGELETLDKEITNAVAAIPPERRKLVTDHDVFGYFADQYGFQVIGAVAPSLSTLSQPSAQELAALQDQIKSAGVPAIFVGTTVNPALEEQIGKDLGIQVVPLYTESLSAPDGPAPTYLDFMRYDVKAIVEALK